MSFLGFQILYMLRVNLSVTIVSMVQSENESQSNSVLVDKFHWDERQQGLVLSSFFWGYVVTQFPGGRLADTFGSKWLFGGGILITSILTVLSPLVARYDYRLFMVCRVLEGAFEVSALAVDYFYYRVVYCIGTCLSFHPLDVGQVVAHF